MHKQCDRNMHLGLTARTIICFVKKRSAEHRDRWERTRLLAAISIQPHVSKKITPRQLIPLPWDNKEMSEKPGPKPHDAVEARKRFEQLAARGL